MKKLALAFLVLAFPALAAAQAPRDPTRLFPNEAAVTPAERPGRMRLPLTPEVLGETQPDFSDVRLYDVDDEEVPFLVDSGWRPDPYLRRHSLELTHVERRVDEPRARAPQYVERIVVHLPATEGRRVLGLAAPRARFVRSVVIRNLATGDELHNGSLFRFPSPLRQRLLVELPELGAEPVDLEVELSGEEGYLEPSFELTVTREVATPPVLRVPLEEVARETNEGVTVLEYARPSGLVPDRLRFSTSTTAFAREVRVYDVRQGDAQTTLAEGRAWRVPEIAGAQQLEMQLDRARGDRIRIEIDDQDSPALDDLSVEAEVRQPGLVFYSQARALTLRFGGGRARAPRYDLAGLAGAIVGSFESESQPDRARLGPTRPNPRFDDGPALRFAMSPGRALESGEFTHVAELRIRDASEGLTRVVLPPSVLSAARVDRADVRVVDEDGRQRPYLWGADAGRALTVRVGVPEATDEVSTYAIELPAERVTVRGLAIETDAEYLARAYTLRGIDAGGRWITLASGSFYREPTETASLEISCPPTRVTQLELEMRDGDDAPLNLSSGRLTIESPPLFLAAADGVYTVLAGAETQSAPTYEIERARALVLAVRAADAEAMDASANPEHVEPAWYEDGGWSSWAVWGVLLLAMLVLGLLTIRVARQGDPEPEPGAAGPEAEPEPAADGSAGDPPEDPDAASTEPLSF